MQHFLLFISHKRCYFISNIQYPISITNSLFCWIRSKKFDSCMLYRNCCFRQLYSTIIKTLEIKYYLLLSPVRKSYFHNMLFTQCCWHNSLFTQSNMTGKVNPLLREFVMDNLNVLGFSVVLAMFVIIIQLMDNVSKLFKQTYFYLTKTI